MQSSTAIVVDKAVENDPLKRMEAVVDNEPENAKKLQLIESSAISKAATQRQPECETATQRQPECEAATQRQPECERSNPAATRV